TRDWSSDVCSSDLLHDLAPDIPWSDFSRLSPGASPIEVCQIIGEWYANHSNKARKHFAGQFFTPPIVARYMANLAGTLHDNARVLDPGAGVGILDCAICESAKVQKLTAISVVDFESDPVLHALCSFTLNYAHNFLREQGIK